MGLAHGFGGARPDHDPVAQLTQLLAPLVRQRGEHLVQRRLTATREGQPRDLSGDLDREPEPDRLLGIELQRRQRRESGEADPTAAAAIALDVQGNDEMPARMEGIDAIRGKNAWWYDNHEIHTSTAAGPFCGQRDDRFAALFEMDVTFKPTGQRTKMREVGLYTVENEKVVQEEFWYQVD